MIFGPIHYAIAGGFLALAAFAGLQTVRLSDAKADLAEANMAMESHLRIDAEAEARAQEAARLVEQYHAKELNDIATRYEQDKRDAQAKADAVVADLRSGALRLQRRWQGCESVSGRLPDHPANQSELDAAERERQESAGRAIGAAEACDAQVAALQDALRKVTER